ncbi:MAG: heavy metal sensor histidine kinase [Blastocatellia bacterium]|nr:heavy metal sensor histidine kinase [Blastocatellia bacterium]
MNMRSIRFRLTVWYAGLLAGMLVLFGFSVYLGLSHYLELTLKETLSQQAKQIGESWLGDVGASGESYVAGEINEHLSPQVNDRFVRITRADDSVMYMSDEPESKGFDPSRVPPLKARAGQESLREEHLTADSELMIFASPFSAKNGDRYVIEVGASNREIERVLHGLLLAIAIGLPVVVAIAIAGGYLLMRRALRPVDEITQSAERITSRNLSERLPAPKTGDEIERLSVGLNRMIARLDESFQHIHRFSADASHELRTPLTILRGELEAATQQPQITHELRETLGSALEETERLSRIVESLMAIARLDAGEAKMERARFDLAELTSSTTDQMRLLAEDKDIALRCEAKQQVRVEGDRSRLKQVIVNLVDNAIKYTPAGGHVGVKVYASNGFGALEVNDNGVGIPAEALPHIFERFYRVDKARSRQMGGAGLGLSITKAIVTAHGGQVRVESIEGKGSRFLVELPLDAKTIE